MRRLANLESVPLASRFGLRSAGSVARDLGALARGLATRSRFALDLRSAGLLRPDLALPAYAGLAPDDGLAPVFNLFDRAGAGRVYKARTTRATCRDFRGGRLSYDEHDGVDFVCPPGTPVAAAAPGVLVATRDTWLRGGLTAFVDHGFGLLTSYTHLACVEARLGAFLARGERFATSGASGADMTLGFPWVPPHVHFMAWSRGAPVDPYALDDEPGLWVTRNEPRPAELEPSARALDVGEPVVRAALGRAVDPASIARESRACIEPRAAAELARAWSLPERAALLADLAHHHPEAFDDAWRGRARPPPRAPTSSVRLTLPFAEAHYRGARFADAPWTRPG